VHAEKDEEARVGQSGNEAEEAAAEGAR